MEYLNEHPLGEPIPTSIHEKAWNLLLDYYVTGGLPASIRAFHDAPSHAEGYRAARKVLNDLIYLYQSDFAKHSGKENALHIERVFSSVPEQLARAVDTSVKKFQFKGVLSSQGRYSTIASPLTWLKKASLIIQVPIAERAEVPLMAHSKENFFKLYFFDVGLLGAKGVIPVSEIAAPRYGMYKGFYAENFIAQELNCALDQPFYSWQSGNSEVEFLVQSETGTIPIEVKSGRRTRARSLGIYRTRYDPKLSIVFNANPQTTVGPPYSPDDSVKQTWPLYLSWRALAQFA